MVNRQEGIWKIDATGKTVFASDRMAEILGTSVTEMLNQHSFVYVYPEDAEAEQRLFESKKRGQTDPFYFRLRRKDGSGIWVTVQGTPLHDPDGTFRGIIGTFRESAGKPESLLTPTLRPGREGRS
jgi:PAS domain S-box-containing protein